MTTTNTAHSDLAMAYIALEQIVADPNQPRHYYNPISMDELIHSIHASGLLQPILVRPISGDKYMIVCGERRYRACKALYAQYKQPVAIPCTIRHLSDQEALEVQIAENLQRADISPMEEATAFKSLRDASNYSIEDIALRLGKSSRYVMLRIQLNALIDEFKEMLNAEKLSLSSAYKLCKQTVSVQQSVLKYCLERWAEANDWRNTAGFYVASIDNVINAQNPILADAHFDPLVPINDYDACTHCSYNTDNAPLLFTDDATTARCLCAPCFIAKNNIQLKADIADSLTDTNIVLICYNPIRNLPAAQRDQIKHLKQSGHKIYDYDEYEAVEIPTVLSFEAWHNEHNDSISTDLPIEQAYAQYVEQVNTAHSAYLQELNKGMCLRGLIVGAWNDKLIGTYISVVLPVAASPTHTTAASNISPTNALIPIENDNDDITTVEATTDTLNSLSPQVQYAFENYHATLVQLLEHNIDDIDAQRELLETSALLLFLLLYVDKHYANTADYLLLLGATEDQAYNSAHTDTEAKLYYWWHLCMSATPSMLNRIVRRIILTEAKQHQHYIRLKGFCHPYIGFLEQLVQAELPQYYDSVSSTHQAELKTLNYHYTHL